jgi:hypothetical protein
MQEVQTAEERQAAQIELQARQTVEFWNVPEGH